jgi:alpha-beta hydrolase superfamily lysophospholipase
MNYTEFFIKSINGKINVIKGTERLNPKCVLLFLHGFGGHFQPTDESLGNISERIKFFKDYQVFGFEFQGHGKSDGDKFYINDINDLVYDLINTLDYVHNYINKKNIPKKIIICGNSVGCTIILKYLVEHNMSNYIKGCILLAPLLKLNNLLVVPSLLKNYVLFVTNCFPKSEFTIPEYVKHVEDRRNTSSPNYTYNNNIKYTYKYDKLYFNTAKEMNNIESWINTNINSLKNIKLPFLIFQGLKDEMVDCDIVKKVASSIEQCKLVLLRDSDHGLLLPYNNEDKTPILICFEIQNWINKILY